MNEILLKMIVAAAIQSVKSPERKAKLKKSMRWAVQSILLAYADDPDFLNEDEG